MPRWLVTSLVIALIIPNASAQEAITPVDGYAPLAEQLARSAQRAIDDGSVPALSIALVDDQRVVWAAGFGLADPDRNIPATAESVYRVGSVSKLFTDLAAMQLVEQGKLDLDRPVSDFLPDFHPENPFDRPVTLRQLMSHRSGLVRESPVGHYFDPDQPSIADTVASLNPTRIVYEPETRTKYSNAGVTVVGRAVEVIAGRPFAEHVQDRVLEPLGMKSSGFVLSPAISQHLAQAQMWTYDGRTFDAPTFALGTLPAGNLYSNVLDLGRFVSALFADGKGIVRPETLHSMFEAQFQPPGTRSGFGLGFSVGEHGTGDQPRRLKVGHGGAVYGFSTQLAALPEEKLAVIVVASRDCSNGLVSRIADQALAGMRSLRDGQPLAAPPDPGPALAVEAFRPLVGRYRADDGNGFDLWLQDDALFTMPLSGNARAEVQFFADGSAATRPLIVEGADVKFHDNMATTGGTDFPKVPDETPAASPDRWRGLIGEYGWDHNTLYILERDGKLFALIEWFFLYPLEEKSDDRFAFPDWGMYHGEELIFHRGPDGKATNVVAASVRFARRPISGEDGEIFQIRPTRPVDELRAVARESQPPAEQGDFRPSDLVELTSLDPTIRLDIRYASDRNFMGTPFYTQARAFLQRPAAEALVRVHQSLAGQGLGLLVHDAYRPWSVTKMFWEGTTGNDRNFVADPSKGSKHNRGCAVDLSLYDLKSGEPIEMVSGYDEFSDRARPFYPGGTSRQRWHRDLLRRSMEAEAFTVNVVEWWHFDFRDWPSYSIQDQAFEDLTPP